METVQMFLSSVLVEGDGDSQPIYQVNGMRCLSRSFRKR